MEAATSTKKPKILIIATVSGGYAGADYVGQQHLNYATNTNILPVRCPSMFSEDFYINAFEKGIDGIIVMYSGTDSPYKGGPERTAQIIDSTYKQMQARGLDTRRLRLAAICTVCKKPFLKQVKEMNVTLDEIGFVQEELTGERDG
ncbi:MAG: hydrogenase iron-sulfur subunit [Chloroflexota bacterium]|nr:hydrogenase iron-sulfur subunit [Chloroflexota bacterium]